MPRCRPAAMLGLLGGLGLAGVGCGGFEPVASYAPETDPAQLYLALTLELRAVNLSTAAGSNTLQLVATPRDGQGAAMAGLPAPTFRLRTAGDSTMLRVTPDGLVTALGAGSNLNVLAELAVPGPGGYPVRHTDTARVSITTQTPPQVLASVSIDPVPPDSAVVPVPSGSGILALAGLIGPSVLKPVALDDAGQSISGLVVEYASLDPTIATIDPWSGGIRPRFPGHARLVARTTVAGVTRADTAVFTMTWPVEHLININAGPGGTVMEPSEVRIVPYGFVEWNNNVGDATDIVFEDPTNVRDPMSGSGPGALLCSFIEEAFADPEICADGDVHLRGLDPDSPFPVFRFRQFPALGVYRFHTSTGATGQVVVTDEVP